MYQIIRTDRTNGAQAQVAHDLPDEQAATTLCEVLRKTSWCDTINRGTVAHYGYRVKPQPEIVVMPSDEEDDGDWHERRLRMDRRDPQPLSDTVPF
jgi:hypothetical protein